MTKGKPTSKKPGKSSGRVSKKAAGQNSEELSPESGAVAEQAGTTGTDEDHSTKNTERPVEEQSPPEAASQIRGGAILGVEKTNPKGTVFAPLVLEKTVIAMPLFTEFDERAKEKERGVISPEPVYPVIIDINLLYDAGREEAKRKVRRLIIEILNDDNVEKGAEEKQGVNLVKTKYSQQYVFAVLEETVIKELVRRDGGMTTSGDELLASNFAIYHIWPDFKVTKLTTKSVSTVKADAARNAFSAFGEGIVWAVMDSGIDGDHPHFNTHKNLIFPPFPDPLQHRDFTVLSGQVSMDDDLSKEIDMKVGADEKPLEDSYGHGTHVAGIIAGELEAMDKHLVNGEVDATKEQIITATTLNRDENNRVVRKNINIKPGISGMAPKCKLVSLKVLDEDGRGQASNLIAAIEWIQEINGNGRLIRIHGVNMSVGYEFEPEWFACGQSPLCVEVNRLVKSGVVVVVAAGNTGYGYVQAQGKKTSVTAGLDLTINDPGNSDEAITVGSTHREKPHVYGVSYFSSKGPTGDGRLKPDLVAPGEKIISCDSTQRRKRNAQVASAPAAATNEQPADGAAAQPLKPPGYYREDSGTSMAAPHVSGVIAAFLSVRREFIGRPDTVKEIFLSTATDLKRERYFQGHGLVDLMRAIQSV